MARCTGHVQRPIEVGAHARLAVLDCAVWMDRLLPHSALLAKHQIDLTVEEVLDELDSAFAAIPGQPPCRRRKWTTCGRTPSPVRRR